MFHNKKKWNNKTKGKREKDKGRIRYKGRGGRVGGQREGGSYEGRNGIEKMRDG